MDTKSIKRVLHVVLCAISHLNEYAAPNLDRRAEPTNQPTNRLCPSDRALCVDAELGWCGLLPGVPDAAAGPLQEPPAARADRAARPPDKQADLQVQEIRAGCVPARDRPTMNKAITRLTYADEA
eukprot:6685380-Pyramimonas_sp.AAC.1